MQRERRQTRVKLSVIGSTEEQKEEAEKSRPKCQEKQARSIREAKEGEVWLVMSEGDES